MDQFDSHVCSNIEGCVVIELCVIESVLGCNNCFVIRIAKGEHCKVQSYKDPLLCWLYSDTKKKSNKFSDCNIAWSHEFNLESLPLGVPVWKLIY